MSHDGEGGAALAWSRCGHWFSRRDGLTSEIHVLDFDGSQLDRLVAAVRQRAEIVAAMGKEGPETFTPPLWLPPQDDDELLMAIFFIAIRSGHRLQHCLSPSRPRPPGPWLALGAGSWDLEIALWPEEVFDVGSTPEDRFRAFSGILAHALELRAAAGGGTVLLTHGCWDSPRAWLESRGDNDLLVVPGT